jgi:hypothetical protein
VKAAIAVEVTQNSKLGAVSCTSASQASCWQGCAFLNKGCYAEHGFQAFTTKRLNAAAAGPVEVAKQEAAAIDQLSGLRPLRLHVVGDCATPTAAKLVSTAAARHQAKAGQPVWTYTHTWRQVDRSAWRGVSVLASCERLEELEQAQARGYAQALVVKQSWGKQALQAGPFKLIPCPAQTHEGVTCSSCKLCFRDQDLRDRRAVIVFSAHGSGAKQVREKVQL